MAVRNLAEQFDGDYQNIDAKLVILAGLTRLVPGPSDQSTALAATTTTDDASLDAGTDATIDAADASDAAAEADASDAADGDAEIADAAADAADASDGG